MLYFITNVDLNCLNFNIIKSMHAMSLVSWLFYCFLFCCSESTGRLAPNQQYHIEAMKIGGDRYRHDYYEHEFINYTCIGTNMPPMSFLKWIQSIKCDNLYNPIDDNHCNNGKHYLVRNSSVSDSLEPTSQLSNQELLLNINVTMGEDGSEITCKAYDYDAYTNKTKVLIGAETFTLHVKPIHYKQDKTTEKDSIHKNYADLIEHKNTLNIEVTETTTNDPEFYVTYSGSLTDDHSPDQGVPTSVIIGSVIGATILVILIVSLFFFRRRLRIKKTNTEEPVYATPIVYAKLDLNMSSNHVIGSQPSPYAQIQGVLKPKIQY